MDSEKVWIEPTRQYWISIVGDEHQSESWKLSIFTNNTNKKLRVGNPKRDIKKKTRTGWWCNNHLEKYEFVNGKDDIPYMKWKIKLPTIYIYTIVISCYIPIIPSYCITVAKLLTKYRCHKHGYRSVLPYAFFWDLLQWPSKEHETLKNNVSKTWFKGAQVCIDYMSTTVLAGNTKYKWWNNLLFQWDYTFHKWCYKYILKTSYNWYFGP